MSYHHFTILFAIILSVYVLSGAVLVLRYEKAAEAYTQTERSFHDALYEAGQAYLQCWAEGDSDVCETAYHTFLCSLYASLGILDNPEQREILQNSIRLFAVLEEKGILVVVCGYPVDEKQGIFYYRSLHTEIS